jgi:hypothetical protein
MAGVSPMDDGRLDARALYAALDEQRRSSGMSWRQVAATIGVSASTLNRCQTGGDLETDGMLAMVRWLGRTPESFTNAPGDAPREMDAGDVVTSGKMLRFDTRALHAALDRRRSAREMTWAQVAAEAGAHTATVRRPEQLTRLAKGGRISVEEMLALVRWLGQTTGSFTRLTDG